MLTKKRIFIAFGILIAIVLIILGLKVTSSNTPLVTPLKELEKKDLLSNSNLDDLNEAYQKELKALNLNNENLLYKTSDDTFTDNIYKGRFVSNEGYTYQFEIDTKNITVNIFEIAKMQIDRENLLRDESGVEDY